MRSTFDLYRLASRNHVPSAAQLKAVLLQAAPYHRSDAWDSYPRGIGKHMDADAELTQSDADLFRWVANRSKNVPGDERRVSKRHNYPFRQWIAPCSNPNTSVKGLHFVAVRCFDLSASGVSFRIAIQPTFQYVIVRLGTTNNPIYVLAEVVHSDPICDAENKYLVGCRFLRKIDGC